MMKRNACARPWYAFAVFLCVSALPPVSAQQRPDPLLASVDALLNFDGDLGAQYTIAQKKPGGSESRTVAAIFRRDAKEQFLCIILEPEADKGKGYLKIDDALWLYDPADRSFTFTSAKERFQNSNARNADFARSTLARDYRIVNQGSGTLGKFTCRILDLEATSDSVPFAKRRAWISEDNLPRKFEDYSLSGTLMRIVAMPTYQRVGTRWLPVSVVIVDTLKSKVVGGKTEYEQTTIDIGKATVKPLADSLYSKEYLERVSR
jgi:outer membrane lipoprotein-sorting protein